MTNIVAIWQSLLKQEREQDRQKGREEAAAFVEKTTEVKGMNGEHGRKS